MATEDREPSLDEIRQAQGLLRDSLVETPVWRWRDGFLERRLGPGSEIHLKMEIWQRAGNFKSRGALLNGLALEPEARSRGFTAVSAGNHAMAVGLAAQLLGTSAKVVMPANANPTRIRGCRSYGAEVVLAPSIQEAFATVRTIEAEEGRTFIHPFEGFHTVLGTATVGLELLTAVPDLEAVVVPIGGGGLAAGMSLAIKALHPKCAVYGVEPEGADSMHRSFAAGEPQAIEEVRTIADSLGAPHAGPYTFGLCRRYLDDLVKVDDDALCRLMAIYFSELKLALEPAAAAAAAAVAGPLRERLQGRKVGVILCGANIDGETFCRYLQRGLGAPEPSTPG